MSEVLNEKPSQVVFDTTLRDGVQMPGLFLSSEDKIAIAMQLAEVGVDVLEAGLPSSSEDNFETTRTIAETVDGPVICAFSGYKDADIENTWAAIEPAKQASGARLNVCLAVSDLHISKRFKMTREEALATAVAAVKRAKSYTDDVEYSAEDASRADPKFLEYILLAVADAGATTIMIPDTVGKALPDEYAWLTKNSRHALDARGFDYVDIAAHCHDDMGLATANTLEALINGGARQLDVTVGGIGERAGNANLEQMAAIAHERPDLDFSTRIDTTRLTRLVRDLARRGGIPLQYHLPVVGRNSFRHASGWHQHGMAQARETFEHMIAEDYGQRSGEILLSDQSGRAGVKTRLEAMSIDADPDVLLELRQRMENLVKEKGRSVADSDLEEWYAELTGEELVDEYHLDLDELVETTVKGVSTVTLTVNGVKKTASSSKGPVDAARIAFNEAAGIQAGNLEGWHGDAPLPDSGSVVDINTNVYLDDLYEVEVNARGISANFASIAAYAKGQNMIHRIQKRLEKSTEQQVAASA